jgi:transcriptional regulator
MHASPAFHMTDDAEMASFIEARRFASLVVAGADGMLAAHIPMILNRGAAGRPTSLEGHVARNNPIAQLAQLPAQALAIFSGADAYVTPSLYLSKREHGKVVPTWNYVAVEVAGIVRAFTDTEALRSQVGRITDMMEGSAAVPWKVTDAPDDYIARQLNGIIGLRVEIASIGGVRKLSQNRSEADRAGVLHGFSYSNDSGAKGLAEEMSRLQNTTKV